MTGYINQQLLRCLVLFKLYQPLCAMLLFRPSQVGSIELHVFKWQWFRRSTEKNPKRPHFCKYLELIAFSVFFRLQIRSYLHNYMWQCLQWLQSIQDLLNVSSKCSLYTSTVTSLKSTGSHMCPCHNTASTSFDTWWYVLDLELFLPFFIFSETS